MRKGRCGRLFVLSAPSGSGKTTVLSELLKVEKNAVRSISATTRPPRPGERSGRDYWFWNRQRFLRAARRGEFIEWAKVLSHWYGTPRRPIKQALRSGKNAFLGIDVQGARQIRRSGLPAATIFLQPPSLKALKARLRHRGTETPHQIEERLKLARAEMKEKIQFDYAVVNDHLQEAVTAIRAIVQAEGLRVTPGKVMGR